MGYTIKYIHKNDIYGFYDLNNEYYIWSGSFKDLLKKLNYENDGGNLKNLAHLRFCGKKISSEQNVTGNDTKLELNYYTDDEHIKTYAQRSYCLVHQIGSSQRILNIKDIFKLYRKEIQSIENEEPKPYVRKQIASRKHTKGRIYKMPNTSGIRLELSRLREDKEYIPTLTKEDLTPIYYYKVSKVENSWKDKKVRHQWQRHIKY